MRLVDAWPKSKFAFPRLIKLFYQRLALLSTSIPPSNIKIFSFLKSLMLANVKEFRNLAITNL